MCLVPEDDELVRFDVLGSLECRDGQDGRVRLGGPVHERVLVPLLLEHGRVVPVSRLVDAVWDENAPATAAHQVRKAVAELRTRIPGGRALIITDGPGYRVDISPDRLDVSRFTEGLRQAREAAAAGIADDARHFLREALALWRGPLLGGSGGAVIKAASAALEERRLAAVEQLFDLRLESGESRELIGELREFIADQPLREGLRGQLMLALFRSGRQADALEEYGRIRDLLVEELGIGPGDELQELHQKILRNSPELAAPAAAPEPAVTPFPTPEEPCCSLPYDLGDFVGREEELSSLLGFVREAAEASGPLIVTIDGMGGSGKTSLALRAAHQLADLYGDAQLYLDLRGHTPDAQPYSTGCAADALLRMLGVRGERIPENEDGRLALWRTMSARKRMLLLLDNAADAAQVRPLISAAPGMLLLITSRTSLVDLDAAHSISLGTMPPEDSTAVLVGVLGKQRTQAEPEAVAELTELCGHLPLALRIAAARLRKRPRWTVRYLVERLRDDSYRLAELSAGERSVEVTLRLSYEGLDARHRQAIRVLARHPGPELDVYAAAALLGKRAREAEYLLEHLLDVHLLQQHEPGRYAFHDLVRDFVRGLMRTADSDGAALGGEEPGFDPAEEAEPALRRLLDFCQAATDAACDMLFPGRDRKERPETTPEFKAELPSLGTPEQARAWFERNQDALLDVVDVAYRGGMDRQVALLARNVVFQLDLRGCFPEFRKVSSTAVAASRRAGDLALLRLSLSNLAVANWKLGQIEEGIEAAREAHELAAQLGDQRGRAKDTGVLGLLLGTLGQIDEALPCLEESIDLKRRLGTQRSEAESLTNLSELYRARGRFEEAAAAAARAVELDRRIGARDKEIDALCDLALAKLGLGEAEAAADALRCAEQQSVGMASPADSALVLALSAEVRDRLGEPARAVELAEKALAQEGLHGAPIREATVTNVVARLYRRHGEYSTALDLHRHAHSTAVGARYLIEEAHALYGMAAALDGLGDVTAGSRHRREADEAFDAMGVPEECRNLL